MDDQHKLLPGYRFYPTEEELYFYLHTQLHCRKPEIDRVIPSIDIYNYEPFQLPALAGELCHGDTEHEWFFFTPQQDRVARGGRPTRTTTTGYWKATGSPSNVYSSQNKLLGVKKTMVFYKGKAPIGVKTKWKMNEYKAIKQEYTNSLNNNNNNNNNGPKVQLRDELSLCRVYVTPKCARAFGRQPTTTTTTTTVNISSATQNGNLITTCDYNNNMQITGHAAHATGPSSRGLQDAINGETTLKLPEVFVKKSEVSTNSEDIEMHDCGTLHGAAIIEECCSKSFDIEIIENLDNLIDWEQFGCF